LLGNGGTSLESLAGDGFPGGTDETARVETMMFKEVFIFDGDGGLFDIIGQIFDFDWGAVLVVVYLVEELSVAIENFGGDGVGIGFAESRGRREVFKEEDETNDN